jgi:hypothetical protein
MATTSIFSNLDYWRRIFGFFMNCAASLKISALLGEDRGDEAGQMLCDLPCDLHPDSETTRPVF